MGSRFLDLCRNGDLKPGDAMLDIGASELNCRSRPEVLNEFLSHFGARPYPPDELARMANFAFADDLFRRAGFRYTAVDYSNFPGVLRLDLNTQGLPWRHRLRYRFVNNSGTSEHILNQYNVFKVIHDATLPGGIMYHGVPGWGDYEHGIITYCPKFFWYLEKQNDYEIVSFKGAAVGEVSELKPEFLRDISFNSVPVGQKVWLQLILRKTKNVRFRGLNDESFSPTATKAQRQ